ncbi:response regulator [Dechloromonas sp. TW-R-39-2]|uniref:response regulator n=1 Tax=Dechloromonas sp. TW-R-39-2 TaxID=2654218 RepID=UPI00193D2336|nr:response regulator [Dechloromonas sp. TW-R-39-2]QRM19052.1 response regulator [Dechloromonas sp. TW-R-39-2]
MDAALRVYAVDDDQLILDILTGILDGFCQLETFSSGDLCLKRVAEQKPDLFLLDVSMPEIDGYALCRHLKEDWDTQDIPVYFVSGHDDIETRLICYEAGGDDFIVKPFEPAELQSKLAVAGRLLAEKKALHEQAGYAQKTAMSAMVSMGELGVVLQFLSKSFACATADELAAAVLEAMQQYDLQAAVQFRLGDDVLSVSQNGVNLPLEVSVLNHVQHSGRIFHFKSRCVFNYGQVTLMVNNMPVDDADRCGRIRDNGALLAEGAEARLRAIELEILTQRRRSGIESALPRLHDTLDAVQSNYRRNCFSLTQVMIEFQEALMKSYVHLGLTEDQEERMTAMASEFMQRMVGTQDESLQIVGQLEALAKSLEGLLRK